MSEHKRPGYQAPRHASGADRGTPHERLHTPGPSPARPPRVKPFKPHDADMAPGGDREAVGGTPTGAGYTVPQTVSDDEPGGQGPDVSTEDDEPPEDDEP